MEKKWILTLLIGLFWNGQNRVLALENQTTIGVSPAIVETVVNPGEITVQKIRIINSNNRPVPIKAMIKDWVGNNDMQTELGETISAKEWIEIEPADFIMEANSSRDILITILPPIGATPGGHYASIFFNPVFSQDEIINQSGPRIIPRVAVQLMLLVKGEMQEKLQIVNFEPSQMIFWGNSPSFKLEIGNFGNVHLVPRINLKLEKVWPAGGISSVIEENKVIIPGQKRELKLVSKIQNWGKYKVNGEIEYGTFQEKTSLNESFFWILPPVWLFFIVGAGLTSILGLLMMKYRNA